MKWRKSMILPAVAAGLLMMSGCAKKEDVDREPIVINVYDSVSEYDGLQTGWYAGILQEEFNIQLNFLDTKEEGSLEQADLYVCDAAKDSPGKLMEQKLLLDISPYLEEEPVSGTDMADYRESFETWNEPLGQEGIYIIPSKVSRLSENTPVEEQVPLYGIYVNWEAYEKAGMPDIKDMDELLTVMEDMLSEGQQGLVLCNDSEMDLLDHVSYLMGVQGQERQGFLVYNNGRETELLGEDSVFEETLLWLRKAYQRGLLDADSDKMSYAQMVKAYQQGKVLLSVWPKLDAEGYELAPVEEMKVISHGCNSFGSVDTYLAISSDAQETERIIEFVSWLYSTEGIMLSGTETDLKTAGPQGLTWEMENGNPVLTELGYQVFGDKLQEVFSVGEQEAADGTNAVMVPGEWGGGLWQEGTCKLGFQPVVNVEVSPSGFPYNYTLWDTVEEEYSCAGDSWKEHMEAVNQIEYLLEHGNLEVIPGYVDIYHQEPQKIVDKRAACREVIVDYSWKIITEEEDEACRALFEQLQQEVESLGYEDVLEYDRQLVEMMKEKSSGFFW